MEQLLSAVQAELERDGRGPRLATLLGSYARERDDWRAYALFDERTYARNLVCLGELFELLVICWQPGQASPVHNHQGQRCWMAVLEGKIQETHFRPAPGGGPAPLETGPIKAFPGGEVAFITDEIALHEIRPLGPGPAVSLHLYSQPIRECQVYDRSNGRIELRRLGYHSIGGVRQPAWAPGS